MRRRRQSVRARHNLPIALTPFSFRKVTARDWRARKIQNPAAGGLGPDGLRGYGLGMAVLTLVAGEMMQAAASGTPNDLMS